MPETYNLSEIPDAETSGKDTENEADRIHMQVHFPDCLFILQE